MLHADREPHLGILAFLDLATHLRLELLDELLVNEVGGELLEWVSEIRVIHDGVLNFPLYL